MKLILDIVTPTKPLVQNEEIDEITLPTVEGEITILPNHLDLLTKLSPGEATVHKGKTTEHFAVTGGFLEVSANKVTLLADYAVRAQDIEVAKAEEAKNRAQKAISEKESQKDFAQAEADLRRAIIELKVGQKHKRNRIS